MAMHFLFISGAEIFFILFIVVMVFGADKIPGIAKGLGKHDIVSVKAERLVDPHSGNRDQPQ